MVLYYDCGTGTPPPPPPPGGNDNVADATAVTNVDGGQDLTFDNTALTVESGEPVPSAVGAIFRTAWWVITVSGSVSIFATGEGDAGNTNLFIALYSGGPSFGSMVEIASADDCNNSGFINPTVGAGTYYLQVGESANVIDTAVDVFLNTT
jgi:hypothetical protein